MKQQPPQRAAKKKKKKNGDEEIAKAERTPLSTLVSSLISGIDAAATAALHLCFLVGGRFLENMLVYTNSIYRIGRCRI